MDVQQQQAVFFPRELLSSNFQLERLSGSSAVDVLQQQAVFFQREHWQILITAHRGTKPTVGQVAKRKKNFAAQMQHCKPVQNGKHLGLAVLMLVMAIKCSHDLNTTFTEWMFPPSIWQPISKSNQTLAIECCQIPHWLLHQKLDCLCAIITSSAFFFFSEATLSDGPFPFNTSSSCSYEPRVKNFAEQVKKLTTTWHYWPWKHIECDKISNRNCWSIWIGALSKYICWESTFSEGK